MDCLILAAGRGLRLRPLTDHTPKPLIPIAGRGALLRLLDQLPAQIDRVFIVVGHLGEQVRAAVGSEVGGRPVDYVAQRPLDGTGGAVRQARRFVHGDRFLVLNGDDLYDRASLNRLCQEDHAVLVRWQPMRLDEQTWQVDQGRVTGLQLTPAGALGAANAGGYLLGLEWFDTRPVQTPGKPGEWSLPHGLVELLNQVPHSAVEADFWMPCGTFDQISEAERMLTQLDPSR